jgi:hypothetical protein
MLSAELQLSRPYEKLKINPSAVTASVAQQIEQHKYSPE